MMARDACGTRRMLTILAPAIEQALGNAMPPRQFHHDGAGNCHLGQDRGLLGQAPGASCRQCRVRPRRRTSRPRHGPISSTDQSWPHHPGVVASCQGGLGRMRTGNRVNGRSIRCWAYAYIASPKLFHFGHFAFGLFRKNLLQCPHNKAMVFHVRQAAHTCRAD
jgi:hypothetical protein